jgi:hypothetical protein
LPSSRWQFNEQCDGEWNQVQFVMTESTGFPDNIEKGHAASRSRREMLRLSACAGMGTGFTSLFSTVEKASAMIYIPKRERMWDS